MPKRHPNLRPHVLGRRLGAVGIAALFVGGAAACQPVPQVLTDAPGEAAITLTHDGDPVGGLLFLTKGSQHEMVETGPDGTETVSLEPGTWTIDASAQGAPLEGDPQCFETLVADPNPQVTVVSEQTTARQIALEVGPIACF